MNLRSHIAQRDYPTCPVHTRAIAGAEAADRISPQKAKWDEVLPWYQEAERQWLESGENFRAVNGDLMDAIRDMAHAAHRDYARVVAAEHTMIEMERAA